EGDTVVQLLQDPVHATDVEALLGGGAGWDGAAARDDRGVPPGCDGDGVDSRLTPLRAADPERPLGADSVALGSLCTLEGHHLDGRGARGERHGNGGEYAE